MRILMINYEFPPIGGGTGNACYYMLREFARYPDLTIDLVTFSPDNRTQTQAFAPNITIHYVACGPKKALHYWKTTELLRWLISTFLFLRRHLKTNQYHLIHCWSGWPAGILGCLFRRQAPYIIALRGSDIPGYSKRTAVLDKLILKRMSQKIWSSAAAVTIVSRDAATLASKTAAVDFKVIHNGVDTQIFHPAPTLSSHGTTKIIFVGRLVPRKGVRDLLEAIALICRDADHQPQKPFQVTIVGSGPEENDLREFTTASGLTDFVNFRGNIPHDELPDLYRTHDIFILPSHTEAFSNAMQEAIASGLAIISTRTGGAELIDSNGLLMKSHDPADLKNKILKLLENPQKLAEFKNRSAELAKHMGWDACCIAYSQLYKAATF